MLKALWSGFLALIAGPVLLAHDKYKQIKRRLRWWWQERKGGIFLLWHPDSPGVRVPVRRSWLGRLLKPSEFATVGEVLAYYKAMQLVTATENRS